MARLHVVDSRPAETPGITFDARFVGPLVFGRLNKAWAPEGRHAIGMFRGREFMAGVVYEDFTNFACTAHIVVEKPTIWLRSFLRAAFWYPFDQLGLQLMLGPVPGYNEAALRLDKWMGFKEQARIPGVYGEHDLVILSMKRDECRWLAGGTDGREG